MPSQPLLWKVVVVAYYLMDFTKFCIILFESITEKQQLVCKHPIIAFIRSDMLTLTLTNLPTTSGLLLMNGPNPQEVYSPTVCILASINTQRKHGV